MLTASARFMAACAAVASIALVTAPVVSASTPDTVVCNGSRKISDAIGIVAYPHTGVREQTLVEARLALLDGSRPIGTMYVDDLGMRYLQTSQHVTIPGIPAPNVQGIRPIPLAFTFGGRLHLRACRS